MPFNSSAIFARVYGSWKDRGQDALDLTEFDEYTIVCFLSYVYAGDYYPFPAAAEPKQELEEQKKTIKVKPSFQNDSLLDGEGLFSFLFNSANITKSHAF